MSGEVVGKETFTLHGVNVTVNAFPYWITYVVEWQVMYILGQILCELWLDTLSESQSNVEQILHKDQDNCW